MPFINEIDRCSLLLSSQVLLNFSMIQSLESAVEVDYAIRRGPSE
jgi:hypothetical protein